MFSGASLGLIRIKEPTGKYWLMVYVVFCSKCGVLILDGWMADTGWLKIKETQSSKKEKKTENKSLNLTAINLIKLGAIYR